MVLNNNSFTDITEQSGIVWSRDRGDEAISVAWLDYDKDGLPDLWISGHGYNNEAPNSLFVNEKYPVLYINNGDGTFTNLFDEDWRSGFGGDTHGTNWVDFDNDGDRDVLVNSGGQLGNGQGQPNYFFVNRNSNTGILTEESVEKNVVYQVGRSRASIWFDGNGDGLLDFVNLVAVREDGQGPNAYFEQQSDGTFVDRTNAVGLDLGASARYGQLADLNGDGNLDLVIQGTYQFPLEVYDISSGNGFVNITDDFNFPLTSDLPNNPTEDFQDHESARDSVIADFNGDGYNDIFLVRSLVKTDQPSISQNNNRIVSSDLILRNPGTEIGYSFQTSGTVAIDFFNLSGTAARIAPSAIFIGASGRNPTTAELEAFVNISSATTGTAVSNDNPQTSEVDRVAALALNPNSTGVTGTPTDRSQRGVYINYNPGSQTWEIRLNSNNPESIRSAVESTQNITNLNPIGFTNVDPTDNALTDQLWIFNPNNNQFINASAAAGLNTPTLGQSVISGDFDNDKDQDLYVANAYSSFDQPNVLYENLGNGTFRTVPQAGGAAGTSVGFHWLDFEVGSKLATSDFNNDGALDIFVGSTVGRSPRKTYLGTPSQLLANSGNNNNWLQIALQGTQSNRDGIGAQVKLTSGGTTQLREQNGGTHNFAQNDTRLHFGLAQDSLVNNIEIQWPSGITQNLNNISVNQILNIVEPFANNIFGDAGNNLLGLGFSTGKADKIDGLEGNDTINGFGGNDSIIGGAGADSIFGSEGADTLEGGDGGDTLKGGDDNDLVYGGTGYDLLEGNDGDDTLYGNLGNDFLVGGMGFDELNGNEGQDTINGNGGDDLIDGGLGNDRIIGANGNDTIKGGADTDEVFGGNGNDLIEGNEGGDILNGDAGNDTIFGGKAPDIVRGQIGNDQLHGGTENDTLIGGEGTDTLFGNADNDFLIGEGGTDYLYGGIGNDNLQGGNGNDQIFGGAGNDRIIESGDINFTLTNTQLTARGTDTFTEIELAQLNGGGSINILNATAVTQLKVTLDGGGSNDTLRGGANDDDLIGGAGSDRLTGNGGSDRFVYLGLNQGGDTITDFTSGVDAIAISAAAFGAGLTVGTLSASKFVVGTGATDAGDRFIYNNNTDRLLFDADGTGSINAITIATFNGNPTLNSGDIEII
ncbi:hypothetical protein,putative calcium-binding protein [Xenococcus sp. PCC 7305]|uniref:CRTAC homolog protein n=1 Tax=Xenococcus sp. PCC 7305 TaxID=102125 RepID=UPI0002ACC2E0|nr:CRTAC homolog protein [Xenococcus sp. PCC 7305]ELS01009.1 hypothetical protein,putative calcium-binding protein [Xenococcus sp. PCC 7305]